MRPKTRPGPAWRLAAVLLGLVASAATADDAAGTNRIHERLSISAPPAWTDVSAEKLPGVLLRLKGPSGSSFAVTEIHPLDLDNRPAVEAFLTDVLNSLAKKTRLALRAAGHIKEERFNNGVRAELLSATLNGAPRLILAAAKLGDLSFLAVLDSSIAGLMLDETLGALKISGTEGSEVSKKALSPTEPHPGPLKPDSDESFYFKEIALGIVFILLLGFWLRRRVVVG